MARDKKLYDLFLISPVGEVIYTVEKEPDFATNLRTGPWRGSGLARAFEAALAKAGKDQVHFEDFEPYEPSNSAPAGFLAEAVKDENGQVLAVLAVQLSDASVSNYISDTFGDGGISYAIGRDGRLRTAIEHRGQHKLFAETPYKPLIEQAKATGKPVSGFTTSIDGKEAYVSLAPSEFIGQTWYIVADISSEAIFADIRALAIRNGLVAIAVIGLLSILALLVARSITGP